MKTERSKRALRECGRKKRYRSDVAAFNAARTIALQLRADIVPYKCTFCAYWHVGNRPGSRPAVNN